MKKVEKTINLGGRKLTLKTGHVAEQATSAVMAQYGDTVVLATVVAAPMRQDLGYFPLQVEYRERLFAGGKIKGSRWVKRDGRPSDDEVLTARLIDRTIRPLFPKEYNNKDVQVIVTALSVDGENSPDMVAAVAVEAALSASEIPFMGPVATVKVGMDDKGYVLNPTVAQLAESKLELVVSMTGKAIVMIEAGGNQVSEEEVLGGIEFAEKEIKGLLKTITEFEKEVGAKKEVLEKAKKNLGLEKQIKKLAGDKIKDLIQKMAVNEAGYSDLNELKKAMTDSVDEVDKSEAGKIFSDLFSAETRKMLLSGKRPDGRKVDEVRKLSAEVGFLPRTHGSGLFQRGHTQALTIATIGAPSLELTIESAEGEETKRYMHHYSFPPFSVGETGRMFGPGRREIGHGALAEKALIPVIPSEEDFPYTIMLVSEILSSNGSSSMASVCGSSLSLMDAGVPISAPVSGVAMGMVVEGKKHVILTDIAGIEDGNGDMDFKVAGTAAGITAIQLDVKTLGLTLPLAKEALAQAKKGRMKIMDVIVKAIDKPRAQVSQYAPKIKIIKIDPKKIGDVIGGGGKTIKKLIADTGAQIDVEDDGSVFISAIDAAAVDTAVEMIENLVKDVEAGEIYEGEVRRIQPFGAFVEVLPGKDGLVHVSDMSEDFVNDPNEVVKIGDKVEVRVKEIDDLGRINLTMILDPEKEKSKGSRSSGGGGGGYNKSKGGYNDKKSGGGGQRGFGKSYEKKTSGGSSGPHFPASRLMDDTAKKQDR